MSGTDVKKYQRDLPVKLSDDEIRERGIEMAKLEIAKEDTENQIAEVKEAAKQQIDSMKETMTGLTERMRTLAREIRTGECEKSIQVFERIDMGSNMVEIIRNDTMEVVETRPVTEADRQMDLDGVLGKIADDTEKADVANGEVEDDRSGIDASQAEPTDEDDGFTEIDGSEIGG
jgi:hypothetical protein